MKTLDPQELSAREFYQYMVEAVVPRPIAFVSTIDHEGRVNLSPYSFFNAFSASPPVLVFAPVNRMRDNTSKHTLDNVEAHGEVVINIVNYAVVEQMSLASTEYEQGVNEFAKAGLTEVPSVRVKPPRVGECPVAFECRVQQVVPLGSEGGAGHLVICEVLLAHVQEAMLSKEGRIDPHLLDAVGRMGGNYYCRANGEALFEVTRPVREKGIGVDGLPQSIRQSSVLTGSDLARLANVSKIPDATIRNRYVGDPALTRLQEGRTDSSPSFQHRQHTLAQEVLQQGETEKAWAVLLIDEKA